MQCEVTEKDLSSLRICNTHRSTHHVLMARALGTVEHLVIGIQFMFAP